MLVAIRAPVDLVLDITNGLVLHPAIAMVRQAHGALRGTSGLASACPRDRGLAADVRTSVRNFKLRWYRQYGVEECWLVDTCARIEVYDFSEDRGTSHTCSETGCVSSLMNPDADFRVQDIFRDVVNPGLSCGRAGHLRDY